MTDQQILTIALATVPTMLTVLMGILINNARLSDFRAHVDARFNEVDRRFGEVDRRFSEVDRRFGEMDLKMDHRFEDMKAVWRAELHRVEEILDARLKYLEDS